MNNFANISSVFRTICGGDCFKLQSVMSSSPNTYLWDNLYQTELADDKVYNRVSVHGKLAVQNGKNIENIGVR